MSGFQEEDDLLAAEYVLGVLEGAERAAAAARADREEAFASAIAAWEVRLSPLALTVPAVGTPVDLWPRIAESCGLSAAPLAEAAPIPAPARGRMFERINFWRGATALGFAAALAMAALALFRPPPSPLMPPVPLATALLQPPKGGTPAWLIAAGPNKTLSLRPLQHLAIAEGHSLELWALPDGAKVPKPVSLLHVKGDRVALPATLHGPMELMISLEQEGGSPTGLPQGPVLWQGHMPAFVTSG